MRAVHLVLVSLLVLVAPIARAADATVTWTHPTRNVDGSTIPATGLAAIASTRLEYGTCNAGAFGTRLGELTVTGQGTTATVTNLAPGAVCFRAFSRNGYGEESAASNVVARTIAPPVPQPPVLSTTVNVAVTVDRWYRIKLAGTVPIGTPCGETSRTAGGVELHQVDAAAVQLFPGQSGETFWSVCAAG